MSDIVTEVDEQGIAVITLNRPEKRNAVKFAMWGELADLFSSYGSDPAVRAVILTGAGGYFSAGADISEFSTVRTEGGTGDAYDDVGERCTRAIVDTPKPTIAAIEGFCVGGGLGLAVSCDFRIAKQGARFGIPAARLGIVYTALDTRVLMNVVGVTNAKRILFTGAQFQADQASELGLIDELVDIDALTAAREFAAQMAANAPLSIAGAKQIVNAIAAGDEDADALSVELSAKAKASDDYREGVAAFAEKRPAKFTGR